MRDPTYNLKLLVNRIKKEKKRWANNRMVNKNEDRDSISITI